MKQPSELNLISGEGSESQSQESSQYSESIEDQRNIAKNAINGAIDAQGSYESSSLDTLKPPRHHDYSSAFIMPNNHLKLTKLKREINNQRSE